MEGGGQVGGAKTVACERLSTFSDSAGFLDSESGRTAGPSIFCWTNHIAVEAASTLPERPVGVGRSLKDVSHHRPRTGTAPCTLQPMPDIYNPAAIACR